MSDSSLPAAEVVTKLDAARRQLATAIELWFHNKDQVSVHALSFAAYEVVDAISKKNGRTTDLLFDSLLVKDEARPELSRALKKCANFFKHGDKDPNGTIELFPIAAEMFMMFAILGLETMGVETNAHEKGLLIWFTLARPELLTESGTQFVREQFPVEALEEFASVQKAEFFEMYLELRRKADWRIPIRTN
jgi:hypothetical protein